MIFGSDWPLASLDAMGRIYSITHRGPLPGGPDQRLPLTAAIDDYTRECAYATFDEKQKGTLAPGMLADVVVLAADVFPHEPGTRRHRREGYHPRRQGALPAEVIPIAERRSCRPPSSW